MSLDSKRITVGKIIGLHGVKGLLKIKSFTETKNDIFNFSPFYIDNKKLEKIIFCFKSKEHFVCKLEDCNNRDDAKKYINKDILVNAEKFPSLSEKEYYQYELIGFKVTNENNDIFGDILQFHEFGAGPVIEVIKNRKSFFLPIDKKFIKDINIKSKKIILDLPEESFLE